MPRLRHHLARLTGYLLALGGLLLVGSLAGYALRELRDPSREIMVHFPETSTLMEGDPAVESGVPVGRVRSIEFRDGVPVTTLELFHKRPLGKETRFLSVSHSLMGARQVWLVPGASSEPLDESTVHPGFFVPSLVDRMHEAEQLVATVAEVERMLDQILHQEGGVTSLAALQQALTTTIDAMSALAERLDAALKSWPDAMDEVKALLASATTGLGNTGDVSDVLYTGVQEHLTGFGGMLSMVEGLLARLEGTFAALEDPGYLRGALYDRGLYEELTALVKTLDEGIRAMREDGLPGARLRRN